MKFNLEQLLLIAQVALAAAAAAPGVDPKIAGYVQVGLDAVTAGYNGVKQGQAGVDPAALKPIDPIS